jgi:hypothetical protein
VVNSGFGLCVVLQNQDSVLCFCTASEFGLRVFSKTGFSVLCFCTKSGLGFCVFGQKSGFGVRVFIAK